MEKRKKLAIASFMNALIALIIGGLYHFLRAGQQSQSLYRMGVFMGVLMLVVFAISVFLGVFLLIKNDTDSEGN